MSASFLSMRDIALQPSRYYTTNDGVAALSATKELVLLYYQPEYSSQTGTLKPVRQERSSPIALTYMAIKHPKMGMKWEGTAFVKELLPGLPKETRRPKNKGEEHAPQIPSKLSCTTPTSNTKTTSDHDDQYCW